MLADLDDINTFLPQDKLRASDGDDDINRFQIDVDRVIKGYLTSTYSATTLAAWDDPTTTPAYIRACAGRLIAAFFYRKKLSENNAASADLSYPQRIYNEAMEMLMEVRSGLVDLPEVTETAGTDFSEEFFYPQDDTDISFTKAMRF
jgi:hypothetical protein